MRHRRMAVAVVAAATLAGSGIAMAHPGHGDGFSDQELFEGEGVLGDKQHGSVSGHLPAKQENVELIGKAGVDAPAGTDGDMTERVSDVSAFGDYAYLTSFRSADCLGGGAWIVDISDPTDPDEVGFLPTTDGNYAGEGSQVIDVQHGPFAGRQLFLHQNETCDPLLAEATGKDRFLGGVNIWDVTDPLDPELLVEHAGDDDGERPNTNTVHSMFAWNSDIDEKVYAVLVDNEEFTDVDIMDITDPSNPVMVNDALDLAELFDVDQAEPDSLTSVFSHDMVVSRKGERYVMNMNYWDGGYVLLDVTDPTPGNVSLIAESDYASLDEERLARGHEISPEGNGHQSEFSPDFRFLIGTDEDFNPHRITHAEITSGPFAGTEFAAAMAGDARPVTEEEPLAGNQTFVGLACEPGDVPAGTGIALVERGTCAFQVKIDNVVAAGYDAGIVFNSAIPGCNTLLNMLAVGDIPFLFVGRETGLRLLGVDAPGDAACDTATPDVGTPSADVSIEAEFDGWGYVRLFRTMVPGQAGTPGSIKQTDTYTIPEAQDPELAIGSGDLSVHEVATDPRRGSGIAYLSYYSGGFRVIEYGNRGIREVGAFIDDGGNNFWGVEVHKHSDGQYYVLASDRDFGLYIFQYTGKIRGKR